METGIAVEAEKTEEVTLETQEQVVDENTKAEVENVTTDEVDDDSIEWEQTAPKASLPNSESTDAEGNDNSKAELEALRQENATLKSELANLTMIKSDPLVKAYGEYLQATDSPTLKDFLGKVGAISTSPVEGLVGEELVKKHFTELARSKGFSGEELEDVVEEKLDVYRGALRLDKKEFEEKANLYFTSGKSTSIEDLENEFKTVKETKNAEVKQWVDSQFANCVDFVNRVVSKGKYNGRAVDRKWGDAIIETLRKSSDVFNPEFVQFTEPNKEGISDLYTPSVIDFIDTAKFRNELRANSKKKADSIKVEVLEEKAAVAHNTNVQTEKTMQSGKHDPFWENWEKAHGKRHGEDPRPKK